MMKPARYDELTSDDLARACMSLAEFFKTHTGPGDEYALAYESTRAGMDPPKLLALLEALHLSGKCRLFLAVYHTCEEHRIDLVSLGKDVHIPFECEGCGEMVEDEDELSFDVIASFEEAVTL